MIRSLACLSAVLLISTAAHAEPVALTDRDGLVALTDKEMDQVRGGFIVHPMGTSAIGIATFSAGVTTIIAGDQERPLPTTELGSHMWSGHRNSQSGILTNN